MAGHERSKHNNCQCVSDWGQIRFHLKNGAPSFSIANVEKKSRQNWYQRSFNSAATGSSLTLTHTSNFDFNIFRISVCFFFSTFSLKADFAPRKLRALLIRVWRWDELSPSTAPAVECVCMFWSRCAAYISTRYAQLQPIWSSSFVFCSAWCPVINSVITGQISCHVKVHNKLVLLLSRPFFSWLSAVGM